MWSDEFNGAELDRSKWDFRLHMMHQRHKTWTDAAASLDGKGNLLLRVYEIDIMENLTRDGVISHNIHYSKTARRGLTKHHARAPNRNSPPIRYNGRSQLAQCFTQYETIKGLSTLPICPDVFMAALTTPA